MESVVDRLPSGASLRGVSLLSRNNQLTIPVDVMRAAGLKPGDDIAVRAVGPGRLELVKSDDILSEFAGALGRDAFPDGYLSRVRDEWR